MSARQTILVVDDEPLNREILKEILEPEYDVALAESGSACLGLVATVKPQAILLDINMPGLSGYEVCDKLKKNSDTTSIPVTFVSALDTLTERLAGYEVGGDDYITKPFEAEELLSKVQITINNQKRLGELQNDAFQAMSTAMTAMTSTGELGVIIQFVKDSFSCSDFDELAKLVVSALSQYGLRAAVQIRLEKKIINHSTDGAINPLESTILVRIYKENRIIDMGSRSIFNYTHVSILAKGMPLNDEDKCGRYKDHLALLADGFEERVKGIIGQNELRRKQVALANMVSKTKRAMEEVGVTHEENKIKSIKILGDLIKNAEKSFYFLGLSENQEESFMEMINSAVSDTLDIYNDGLNLDSQLNDIIDDAKESLG